MRLRATTWAPGAQATSLADLPKELVATIVSHLPYATLPAFRTTCKLSRELVDAASNGWVMKVEEGEALLTSGLLQRLTSLVYVWFERWTWEGDQEANFLAVILTNLSVFARLKDICFPKTSHIPLRCLRGLLAALPAVTSLALPPLPPDVAGGSPQHRAALSSVAGLTSLVDLTLLEGWALTDVGARLLGQGLPRLQRAVLGNTAALSREGYAALAQLRGLQSLTLSGARGDNTTLEPLSALTGLSMLRVDLARGFRDTGAGPMACLPALRTLGWWHEETQPAAGLRPGCLAPWLRELSLCVELDMAALAVLAACSGLAMMQIQSVVVPTAGEEARLALPAAGPAAAPPRQVVGAAGAGGAGGGLAAALPVLPSLRTLILGELWAPPPEEPQPVVSLAALFPCLENLLAFAVAERGLVQLAGATRLKRLVLHCPQLRDEALGFLPLLPSLTGLQLEGCLHLTAAAAGALRSLPRLEQLLLLNAPAVGDAFLTEAAAQLRGPLRTLVLAELPDLHDEGLQALAALAGSLETLELRCLPALTPAGLQVVAQLPRVSLVAVSECERVGKAFCRELAATLAASGRDVAVEHETTALVPVSLADEFGEPPTAAAGATSGALEGGSNASAPALAPAAAAGMPATGSGAGSGRR